MTLQREGRNRRVQEVEFVEEHSIRLSLRDVRLQSAKVGIAIFRWDNDLAVEHYLMTRMVPDGLLKRFEPRRLIEPTARVERCLRCLEMDL